MIISWYGEGCFKIQNGEVVLLTDIPEASSGITPPRLKADVVLKTFTPWPFDKEAVQQADAVIYGAGEYDVRGMRIKGYELAAESSEKYFKTIYSVLWDDIKLGFLGHVSGEIPPQLLETFEEIDVLIGPAGGDPFMGQEAMQKLVKMLNPKIFIPSLYAIPGLKREAGSIDDFFKGFSGDVEKGQDKFTFKKKDIQDIKKTKIICLSA
jgi:L-ascorbate metabolism protein UlaG (beta-lactamase superfamily)